MIGLNSTTRTHLPINLVFTGDSSESLVYDILQQNGLHAGHLMLQLARHSRYRGPFFGSLASKRTHTSSCSLKIGVCHIGVYAASCRRVNEIRWFVCELQSLDPQSFRYD
ncbi:hypothetical protein T265_11167 [Opisthorchis viverrini]|uniref:Uncharacterized protein n=1 Tax=Opisthorchis viverrini TaxID=6198 RepID=A0A074YZZ4_OPIVI|nr:hypothetical protein T265_11167 [Opisthorchis viverrini]KER20228.1 hypothetical protein T265_11167 [Opisthorchis viverrini]